MRTQHGHRYTLDGLIEQVMERRDSAVDVITDTRNMNFSEEDGKLRMETAVPGDIIATGVNDHALGQLATVTKIGTRYARLLRDDAPDMLAYNLNERLHRHPQTKMGRFLHDDLRALVSNSYNATQSDLVLLRGVQIGMAVNPDWAMREAVFTDKRLHIKMVLPTVSEEIAVGDEVRLGLTFRNSEVGVSATEISMELFRLVCLNGMVVPDQGLRRVHLGRRNNDSVVTLSSKTIQAGEKAMILELADVTKQLADPDNFRNVVAQMRGAAECKLDDPPAAAFVMSKAAKLSEDEEAQMMRELFEAADNSVWGLANSLTATARDMEDYERKVELETFAGNMTFGTEASWDRYATARA